MKQILHAAKRSSPPVKLRMGLIILLMTIAFIVAGQKQILLYPGIAPGSESWNWEEKETFVNTPLNANVIYNITKPSLTVFTPDSANGCAIIICPGGAYHVLNIENEGMKIAKELVKKGITVFIFKYRLVRSLTNDPWQEMQLSRRDSIGFFNKVSVVKKMAYHDLIKAIEFVRNHSTEYGLSKTRIGLMGFSAGGTLAAGIAYNFTPEAKPDFVAPVYSVITTIEQRNVKPDAPPLFIAAATDDQLAPVSNSISLYNDWINAKRPAELHIYATGGHGLKGSVASQNWITRFTEWLESQNFITTKQ